jgi:hypothetical protein
MEALVVPMTEEKIVLKIVPVAPRTKALNVVPALLEG